MSEPKLERRSPSPLLPECSRSPSRLSIERSLPQIRTVDVLEATRNARGRHSPLCKAPSLRSRSPTISPPSLFNHNVTLNTAGTSVLGQLDCFAADCAAPRDPSERQTQCAQRRQVAFEDLMAARLERFCSRELTRTMALTNLRTRERDSLVQKWRTIVVLQSSMSIFRWQVRMHRASATLRRLFVVRFVGHLQRKSAALRRKEQLRARESVLLRLDPSKLKLESILRCVACLAPLPDNAIQVLITMLKGICFLANETVVQEDAVGTGVYFLHSGAVELRRRRDVAYLKSHDDGPSPHPRITDSGTCIASAHLLAEEPHEHTVVCVVDSDLWFLARKSFFEVVSTLSKPQAEPIHRMIDERRELNMVKYNSLSEDAIRRSSTLFSLWSSKGIRQLLQVLRPCIFRKGDVMITSGHYGKAIIFVVGGRAEILHEGKRPELVRDGQCVGDIPAVTQRRDRLTSMRALTICDCWILPRNDFLEALCHETPLAFVPSMMTLVDSSEKERPKKTD